MASGMKQKRVCVVFCLRCFARFKGSWPLNGVERGVPEHCSLPSFLTVFLPLNRLTFRERETEKRERKKRREILYVWSKPRKAELGVIELCFCVRKKTKKSASMLFSDRAMYSDIKTGESYKDNYCVFCVCKKRRELDWRKKRQSEMQSSWFIFYK